MDYGFEAFAKTIHLGKRQRPAGGVSAPLVIVGELVWATRAWNQSAIFG